MRDVARNCRVVMGANSDDLFPNCSVLRFNAQNGGVIMVHGISLTALGCAILFTLGFCYRPPSLAKSIIKTTSTLLLALISWYLAGQWALTSALLFGALGDLMLSRTGDRAFLIGLVSFALAHLFYAGLMFLIGTGTSFTAWILLVIFGAVMARLLFPNTGELRWPVMGYIAIIVVMGIAAFGTGDPIITLAAVLFIGSDAVLSAELFLLPATATARKVTPFVIWTLYWGAQALFLYGFLAVS